MNKPELHIILIGFQGAGKTTIGKKLAQELHEPRVFIDTDNLIRQRHGTHRSIIAKNGIQHFRELEVNTIKELLTGRSSSIIAFGGGTFLNEQTRKSIKQADAITIFIDRPFDTMWQVTHTKGCERETGPMTLTYDKGYEIYKARKPIYQLADVHIEPNNNETVDETLDRIKASLMNTATSFTTQ